MIARPPVKPTAVEILPVGKVFDQGGLQPRMPGAKRRALPGTERSAPCGGERTGRVWAKSSECPISNVRIRLCDVATSR
jgi:hypothetical protein